MSISVRVPTILRTYTGGESEVTAGGSTLKEVLDSLDETYPGIKGRIVDEQGALRRFVNVYVGNDDVRFLDGLATPVSDGSQVSVIPAVAGG
ncbi:MAG: MoaD/ThiS family protein [Actinomycetota bacterium]|jgi:molybdopterin converting factor small subunit|nr:MoaD/ThiS family protein [Actinomycetota bacterium]